MPFEELLNISSCGWLLNVLRYPYFKPNAANSSQTGNYPTLATSCTVMALNSLDTTMEDLLYLTEHSNVDNIISHMGITDFAATIRAKGQLSTLLVKYKLRSKCNDQFSEIYNQCEGSGEVSKYNLQNLLLNLSSIIKKVEQNIEQQNNLIQLQTNLSSSLIEHYNHNKEFCINNL